jgi:beta-N-acetylhexosaminidase
MKNIEAAKQALGQLFIIGFSGLELSDETSSFLSQARIGGVILFSPNYENPGQVAELINEIQSVDHEGARVQRFKKGFTKIPEAAAIGAMNSPRLTFEIAEMMAKELKAVGININYHPLADIATNPKNPVIGARAFGSDEETVTKQVTAMLRGHIIAGVQPCVKHFPGHGDTSTDSHFALPRVDTAPEILRDRELRPFAKAFKSHCAMVMTAHILATKLDPKLPATLSKAILQDLLRKEMRYTGLIISDDMEMKAITDHFGPDEAPRMAIEAGCDLLIYRSEAKARAAYEALTRALETGKLAPEIVLTAEQRSTELKKKVLMPYEPASITDLGRKIGTPENQAIVDKITATS